MVSAAAPLIYERASCAKGLTDEAPRDLLEAALVILDMLRSPLPLSLCAQTTHFVLGQGKYVCLEVCGDLRDGIFVCGHTDGSSGVRGGAGVGVVRKQAG